MRKEIAQKWVKVLRSGKYKQTIGLLKKENSYCCLGVLCEISKLGKWEANRGWLTYKTESDYSIGGVVPNFIMKWSGLKTPMGCIVEDSRTLAQLNDSGKSFEEIAHIIEENWKKL